MAQGASCENLLQEALGKGDQAGSDRVDRLHAQLQHTAHIDSTWRASGNLGFPFETDKCLPPLPT